MPFGTAYLLVCLLSRNHTFFGNTAAQNDKRRLMLFYPRRRTAQIREFDS